jgi:hypothetical protein
MLVVALRGHVYAFEILVSAVIQDVDACGKEGGSSQVVAVHSLGEKVAPRMDQDIDHRDALKADQLLYDLASGKGVYLGHG